MEARHSIKRRIFVAIKISEALEETIEEWKKEFAGRQAFARSAMNGIRWLNGKNLHITLIPPWYEGDIKNQIVKIKTVQARPFEISFARVAYGPDPRRPRLIWAEGETPRELLYLKASAEDTFGTQPERRPFLLHLTLARFRPEDFPQFSIQKLDEPVSWRDEVRSIVLMESRLSPSGADYDVLGEFAFRTR